MPQLTPYTQAEIDSWELGEQGVRDGTSPTITFDREGATGIRKIICNWDTRFDTVRYFLGDVSSYVDGGGITRMSRLLPQALPTRPKFLAAKLAEPIVGHQLTGMEDNGVNITDPKTTPWTAGTVNKYARAKLTIQYERVPFSFPPDGDVTLGLFGEYARYVQYLPGDSSADYITQPASTQKYLVSGGFAPHGVIVPFATGLVDPIHRFHLKWFRVSEEVFFQGSALWNRIFGTDTTLPWLGTINSADFADFAAGQVLLESVGLTYLPDVLGDDKMAWVIDYGFAVKPNGGWNKSWYFPPATGLTLTQKYLVGRGDTWYATPSIPDGYSNYNVRDFADPDHGLFGF